MNARIFEIKRFAVHDGDGIRTTVFFKGCPLRCVWCHNPEGLCAARQLAFYAHKCTLCGACAAACPEGAHRIEEGTHTFESARCTQCGRCVAVCPSEALKLYGEETTVETLLPILLEDRAFYEQSGGGVTLSGGECLLYADFCAALLERLKNEGIHTAVDTCGFVPREAIEKVLPYTDVFLYDLKAYDPSVHEKCTGQRNERILENLRYIDACGVPTEVRIPYVPSYNTDQAEALAAFCATLKHLRRVRVLGYHDHAGSKYEALQMQVTLPQVELPTKEELARAEALFNFKKQE